jgi:hypothetical protein
MSESRTLLVLSICALLPAAALVATAAPALPPLGAPPAGMDREQAKACDAGDAAACVAAARSYAPIGAYRAKLSKEQADAKEQGTTRYAKRACELGHGEGCALAARYGAYGDLDQFLARACELGHVPSCGGLALRKIGDAKTREERLRFADQIAKACLADATDWMASTSHHGGFCRALYELYRDQLKDRAQAKKFLKLQCSQGYKLDCPCKQDSDCGRLPDDEAGLGYFCDTSEGNKCAVESGE